MGVGIISQVMQDFRPGWRWLRYTCSHSGIWQGDYTDDRSLNQVQ